MGKNIQAVNRKRIKVYKYEKNNSNIYNFI